MITLPNGDVEHYPPPDAEPQQWIDYATLWTLAEMLQRPAPYGDHTFNGTNILASALSAYRAKWFGPHADLLFRWPLDKANRISATLDDKEDDSGG